MFFGSTKCKPSGQEVLERQQWIEDVLGKCECLRLSDGVPLESLQCPIWEQCTRKYLFNLYSQELPRQTRQTGTS